MSIVKAVLNNHIPIAVIDGDLDPIGYDLVSELSGEGALYCEYIDDPNFPAVVIVAPTNLYKLDQWRWLRDNVDNLEDVDFNQRMGRLFGYTENEINNYINLNNIGVHIP